MMSKKGIVIAAVAALAMIGMIFAALPAAQDGWEEDQSLGAEYSLVVTPTTVRSGGTINVKCTSFDTHGAFFTITIDGQDVYTVAAGGTGPANRLPLDAITTTGVDILVPSLPTGKHTVKIEQNGSTNFATGEFVIDVTSSVAVNKTTVDLGDTITFTATNLTNILNAPVTFTITDSFGATTTRNSMTNAAGTSTYTYTVPADAHVGGYSVKATDANGLTTNVRNFTVRAEMAVDKTMVKAGERIIVSANLTDSHGPVSIEVGGTVTYITDTGGYTTSIPGSQLAAGVGICVPNLAVGDHEIKMYVQYGTAGQTVYTTTITVTEITEVSVTPLTAEKGTIVTITGKNFANAGDGGFEIEIRDANNVVVWLDSIPGSDDGSFTYDFLIDKFGVTGDYYAYVEGVFNISATGTFVVTMPDLLLSKDSGESSELLAVYSEEFEDDDGPITVKIAGQTVTPLGGIPAAAMVAGFGFYIPTLDVGVHDVEVSAGEKSFSKPFEVTRTTEISLSSDDIKVGDNIVILGVNFSRNNTIYHVGLYDSTNTGYIAGSEGTTGSAGTFTCTLFAPVTEAGEYLIQVYDDEGYFVDNFYFNVREYVWMSPTESGGKSGEVITVISDYFSLHAEEGATMSIFLFTPDEYVVLYMPNGSPAEDLTAAQLMAGVDVILPGLPVGDYRLAVFFSDVWNVDTEFEITESIYVMTGWTTYVSGNNIGIGGGNFTNVKDTVVPVKIYKVSEDALVADELIASLSFKTLADGSLVSNTYFMATSYALGEYRVTATDIYGFETSCFFNLIDENKTVTFFAEQAGGVENTKDSTSIIITFSVPVTDLTNVGVIKGTGEVVAGELSGSGDTWILTLSSVVKGGDVTINIHSFGVFNVQTGLQNGTVTVYKDIAESLTIVCDEGGVNTTGTGSGKYAPNATVTITAAAAKSGYVFLMWTTESDDVIFADELSATTTFTMPDHAVTVTALYEVSQTQTGDEESPSGGMDTTIIIAVVAVVAIGGVGAAYFLFLRKP